MDNSSCWCYLCSQRVTPVVESAGGIRCPHCRDLFVEQMDHPTDSGDRLPLWSPRLLGLVSGDFGTMNNELEGHREGMLFGLVDFSLGVDRESGSSNDAADFARTLADYLLEGEKGVKHDRPRRLQLNRARVCETGMQCCICLEDFKLGEKAEETPCKHSFHGCCISSWLKKGNGTCPMCRFQITDAGERGTDRFASAYRRELNSL